MGVQLQFAGPGQVVLRMVESFPPNEHKVFFDNLFSVPKLPVHLRQKSVFACAILNAKHHESVH